MNRTKFHRRIIALMCEHGHDGGLRELSKLTGIKYRTLWERAQRPREIRMYEFFRIAEDLRLSWDESNELISAIREG